MKLRKLDLETSSFTLVEMLMVIAIALEVMGIPHSSFLSRWPNAE